jgi:hypothetical protein
MGLVKSHGQGWGGKVGLAKLDLELNAGSVRDGVQVRANNRDGKVRLAKADVRIGHQSRARVFENHRIIFV